MFNWKEFDKAKHIFGQVGEAFYKDFQGQHHVTIRPKDLLRWMEFVREDLGYLTLVDVVGVDLSYFMRPHAHRFELIYHLLNMGTHQRLNLHVQLDEGEVVPSIVDFFHHAEWMEREQREMLGLSFDRERKGLLLTQGQESWPLRKDAEGPTWQKEVPLPLPVLRKNPNKSEPPYPEEAHHWERYDMLSPESLGNFEWWVCFDPVKVVNSEVLIGYHHQGWEKLLENRDAIQALNLVDKIQLGAAPTYSTAWAKTIEDSVRIKLPERAQALRMVMLELARIADHLTVMEEICRTLEIDEFRLFIDAREKVYELFEKFCGHRQGFGCVRLGGLRFDLPHGWIVEFQAVAEILGKNLTILHHSLLGQSRFREVLSGEFVNAQTVLQGGVSGPAMRASGLNFDLRKSQPFYFYQDVDFDIPVGIHGTAYDRYLIRYEEIFQSLRIITQVIDNLPLGEIVSTEWELDYVRTKEKLASIETKGWHFGPLESPNGEAGFFLLPGEDFGLYRVKIKSPSFVLAQSLPQFVAGLKKEQLRPCLASLGLRRFEMDR